MTFQYVKPTEEQLVTMNKFRAAFETLAADIKADIQPSRGLSLALTKLEEAAFWLNKGITNNDN